MKAKLLAHARTLGIAVLYGLAAYAMIRLMIALSRSLGSVI